MTEKLLSPLTVGALHLRNRVVMAPLTRSRAGAGDVPRKLNADYYRQRATAGLIISEATQITQQGKGYAWTPGIETEAQIAGWRLVTDAVHEEGGLIVLQLWHVGRISHPSLQPNGGLPVAPSAVKPNPDKVKAFTESGFQLIPTPRPLRTDEMPGIVEDYRRGAANAKAAGFDGVEIHAANGYLIDQFLRDKTNLRTDGYGGSIPNRTRLLREVVDAVTSVWGGDRVGIRFSPLSPANDCADSNPQPVFEAAVRIVDAAGLAYIHLIEGATRGPREVSGGFDLQILRHLFRGAYMANNGYDPTLAETTLAAGRADLIAFGRPFIANPDLVARIAAGAPLAKPDEATFYGGDAHGYVDYPTMEKAAA